jgi:arginyl-tRNA synthetase
MGYGWSESCSHVRFGQILGMSTRRGNAVLLAHLLDEARSVMQENQRRAHTTRIAGLRIRMGSGFNRVSGSGSGSRRAKM